MEPKLFAGINKALLTIVADRSQIEALDILYARWRERFGYKALDHLLILWGNAEARLTDRDNYFEAEAHAQKAVQARRRSDEG